jgi:23S rRNA (guanosine2251-2'-O)-methyltransferase
MVGNSRRRGAMRNPGSKKGATVGSGGQRRRQLEGRGPTPKATERTGHPAARRAAAAERAAQRSTGSDGGGAVRSGANARTGGGAAGGARGRRGARGDAPETIAGRNAAVEALRADVPVSTVYVVARTDLDDRVREVLKAAGERGLPLLEVPRQELDRLTDGAVHQGVALQVPPYDYAHPDDLLARADDADEPALVVALDGVTDPRNLGAVVRSAAAFGAHGVLVPERRAAGMTAGAWKASAGAAARLPVARTTNLARQLADYAAAGVFVVGLAADGDVALGELELATSPLVLVVGSEGRGLSRLVTQACDQVAAIPMASEVESLNAGVAAGVALYAVAARRRGAS